MKFAAKFIARSGSLAILAATLVACGSGGERSDPVSIPSGQGDLTQTGPAADYPMVLGDPYMIDGQLFTPSNDLNHDEVGYADYDADGGRGVTAAHRTLPLPSYIEVTSLANGRTILVRVERRGPMTTDRILGLSPGAMTQLGASGPVAVRVRRVNPVEADRAELRAGNPAPARLDTPGPLVEALRRRLTAAAPAPVTRPQTAPSGDTTATAPLQPSAQGGFAVQAAAFRDQAAASALARRLGGFVTSGGGWHRVRAGPFATREQARHALANVRAAGYADALIITLED